MHPISADDVRTSFVNASRKESASILLPEWIDDADWASLDYLGWRDAKLARRAYVVIPTLDGDPIGVLLRQAEATPRTRAQCSWCRDVKLPNDVVFYSARRAGSAGRDGNTVGVLVCQEFQCSANVRRAVPPAYEGFDVEAARQQRIDDLQLRVAGFAAVVAAR